MPQKELQYIRTSTTKQTFRRTDRIRRRYEYLNVGQCSCRVHTAHFVLLVLFSKEKSRLGVTVTRRVCNAVGRNRVKRLAREVFRTNRHLFPKNSQIVLIARMGAEKLDYGLMREEIEKVSSALKRAARLSQAGQTK